VSEVIAIENIGKKYFIRHLPSPRYNTFRDTVEERICSFFKKQPDSLKEEFWALQDINLRINKGERVAIIGRNGAGKSTLLKMVSRITEPTSGKITLTGRVSSLLEVGTGFHSELTGRENIFLNGAILGMTRAEIKEKFNQIVEFAEVTNFLDTQVKRYSSGMQVRLAFAVAAHLEPEILIIDEVLAVGDFQFQRKCINKMEEVAQGGRTILFVSHNLATVQQLCNRVVVIEQGRKVYDGNVEGGIAFYLKSASQYQSFIDTRSFKRKPGISGDVRILSLEILDNQTFLYERNQPLMIRLRLKGNKNDSRFFIRITVTSSDDYPLGTALTDIPVFINAGEEKKMILKFDTARLAPGRYFLGISLFGDIYKKQYSYIDSLDRVMSFEIMQGESVWLPPWGYLQLNNLEVTEEKTKD
jgi:lipopolysaccharide transport system ATP-binding protein